MSDAESFTSCPNSPSSNATFTPLGQKARMRMSFPFFTSSLVSDAASIRRSVTPPPEQSFEPPRLAHVMLPDLDETLPTPQVSDPSNGFYHLEDGCPLGSHSPVLHSQMAAPDPPVAEAAAEETPVAEASADDTPLFEASAEDTPLFEAAAEDTPLFEAAAEDTPLFEAAAGDTPLLEAAAEDPPVFEAAAEDIPVAEAAFSVAEAAAEEAPVAEAAAEKTPVSEAATEEFSVAEATTEEAPVAEGSAGDTPLLEAAAEDTPLLEAAAEDTPVAEAAAQDTPVSKAAAEETPVAEAATEEFSVAEAATEEFSVAEAAAKKTPVAEAAAEESPVAEAATEETSVAEAAAEDTPTQIDVTRDAVCKQIASTEDEKAVYGSPPRTPPAADDVTCTPPSVESCALVASQFAANESGAEHGRTPNPSPRVHERRGVVHVPSGRKTPPRRPIPPQAKAARSTSGAPSVPHSRRSSGGAEVAARGAAFRVYGEAFDASSVSHPEGGRGWGTLSERTSYEVPEHPTMVSSKFPWPRRAASKTFHTALARVHSFGFEEGIDKPAPTKVECIYGNLVELLNKSVRGRTVGLKSNDFHLAAHTGKVYVVFYPAGIPPGFTKYPPEKGFCSMNIGSLGGSFETDTLVSVEISVRGTVVCRIPPLKYGSKEFLKRTHSIFPYSSLIEAVGGTATTSDALSISIKTVPKGRV